MSVSPMRSCRKYSFSSSLRASLSGISTVQLRSGSTSSGASMPSNFTSARPPWMRTPVMRASRVEASSGETSVTVMRSSKRSGELVHGSMLASLRTPCGLRMTPTAIRPDISREYRGRSGGGAFVPPRRGARGSPVPSAPGVRSLFRGRRGRLPARARSFPRGHTSGCEPHPDRRPVTSRGNRPVRARLLELLEEGLDGGRELRAFAEPVIDALAVDLHVGRVLLRVVVADLLHNCRARRLQRVGDDDTVERGM